MSRAGVSKGAPCQPQRARALSKGIHLYQHGSYLANQYPPLRDSSKQAHPFPLALPSPSSTGANRVDAGGRRREPPQADCRRHERSKSRSACIYVLQRHHPPSFPTLTSTSSPLLPSLTHLLSSLPPSPPILPKPTACQGAKRRAGPDGRAADGL